MKNGIVKLFLLILTLVVSSGAWGQKSSKALKLIKKKKYKKAEKVMGWAERKHERSNYPVLYHFATGKLRLEAPAWRKKPNGKSFAGVAFVKARRAIVTAKTKKKNFKKQSRAGIDEFLLQEYIELCRGESTVLLQKEIIALYDSVFNRQFELAALDSVLLSIRNSQTSFHATVQEYLTAIKEVGSAKVGQGNQTSKLGNLKSSLEDAEFEISRLKNKIEKKEAEFRVLKYNKQLIKQKIIHFQNIILEKQQLIDDLHTY